MAIFGRKFRGGAGSMHQGSGRMDFPYAQSAPQQQPSAPAKSTWTGSTVYHENMSPASGDMTQRHVVNRYSDGSASIKTYQSGTERTGGRDFAQPFDRQVASYKVKEGEWEFNKKDNNLRVKGTGGFPIKSVQENEFNPSIEKDW